jgi:hypothetical protein
VSLRAAVRPLLPLLTSRVVQFLVLGGALFLLTPHQRGGSDIDLRRETLRTLAQAEAQRRGHADAAAVDELAIEDELLFREALRRGFDRGDPILKARLVQKALFYAEESKGAMRPVTEEELRAFYRETLPTWRKPPRYRLRQLMARSEQPLLELRGRLERGELEPARALALGVKSPLPAEADLDAGELARLAGDGLVRELEAAAAAGGGPRWLGPLRTAYGFHLVQLLGSEPAGVAPFEEVRNRVREVLLVKRREDAVAAFLREAFPRYRVAIDGAQVTAIEPQRRLALRSSASGED